MLIKRRKAKQRVLDYDYQKNSRYFAQIADEIKEAGVEELAELGAADIVPAFRGMYFKADKATLYRINYMSRLVSRCLAPLRSFDCPDADALYAGAKQVKWEKIFSDTSTFAVSANVSGNSCIAHSKFASLRLKDAIVDYLRETTGRRPNVDVVDPDIRLNLHIEKDRGDISLDTSGEALHKRGYRVCSLSAPMQETLAAAIVRLSGWDGSVPLYDPMCGSGTLLCEALMHYCRIPAGIFREKFGFECLPDFFPTVWKNVKKEADENIRELPEGLIAGSDLSEQAVSASRTNLMGLHHGKNVTLCKADFADLPGIQGHVIITNPPYGIRMGADQDMDEFYEKFGDFLKQKCKGSTAYIYFGDRRYIKKIGLKALWKKPISAGGLDGRLAKYEMY